MAGLVGLLAGPALGHVFNQVKQHKTDFGENTGNVIASVLDWIGLGDTFRHDILETDRYHDEVIALQKKLSKIDASYSSKIAKRQAQLDAIAMSNLPIPSNAMQKIAEKKNQLQEEINRLNKSRSLASDLGNIAVSELDTSNMKSANLAQYNTKKQNFENLKGEINNEISKDIEERL